MFMTNRGKHFFIKKNSAIYKKNQVSIKYFQYILLYFITIKYIINHSFLKCGKKLRKKVRKKLRKNFFMFCKVRHTYKIYAFLYIFLKIYIFIKKVSFLDPA